MLLVGISLGRHHAFGVYCQPIAPSAAAHVRWQWTTGSWAHGSVPSRGISHASVERCWHSLVVHATPAEAAHATHAAAPAAAED